MTALNPSIQNADSETGLESAAPADTGEPMTGSADAPPVFRGELVTPTLGGRRLGPEVTVVAAEGLRFGYRRGQDVVRGVDLALTAGRVHCLLGDSGSGKSTLLRLIAGLERPTRGRLSVSGRAVCGPGVFVPPERRPVGLVFQDYALFPHLTVRRNITFGMSQVPRRARRRRTDELLNRVGLGNFANAMPYALSGGQQQRVALARALATEPKVMLLDEPFTGLDAALCERVRSTTLRVLREADVAVLMVTHNPREALIAADTVSVMRAGKITVTGRPTDICVRRLEVCQVGEERVCHECIDIHDGTGVVGVG